MFTTEALLKSELPKVRVGIGRGTDAGNVEKSVAAMKGHDVVIYDDPDLLVDDLATGKIDAAVRGDMSSSVLLPLLKKRLEVKSLERIVFLELLSGKMILMAPVGIDEGWTDPQKEELARQCVKMAKRVGLGTKVAVMSGGRCEDVGRCKAVDRSIESARNIAKQLRDEGYDAYHCQILIEDAVNNADILIAPEGITGNIIFRTLHFIGGAKALGAPVVNIDKVFIDTSRVKTDYTDSLALAMRMTEE
ncbi:MAG: methanogen marker protein 4 [Thermoplasmata archaeon]|jgi:putative methanogen marker protein 4|nr:methanogen marker protein 4 [Thermoplasmata archaeon]WII07061.1 methanogenesis marker protein Mmp4/MtxX [Methanomassiliicoccales archaeon LGM-RCC1]